MRYVAMRLPTRYALVLVGILCLGLITHHPSLASASGLTLSKPTIPRDTFTPAVPRRNPVSPHENSPKDLELLMVDGRGFFDGTTCETWPKTLSFASGSHAVGALQEALGDLHAAFPNLEPMVQRMDAMGIAQATSIGSKHTLRVVQVDDMINNEDVVVAFDPFTRVGHAISNRWLCTQSDRKTVV